MWRGCGVRPKTPQELPAPSTLRLMVVMQMRRPMVVRTPVGMALSMTNVVAVAVAVVVVGA